MSWWVSKSTMNKQSGDQELRFTRNRTGAVWCALALPLFFAALGVGAWGLSPASGGPASPEGWARLLSAGVLVLAAAVCFLFGLLLMRRTYVVATPLGLDILPLMRPASRMILLGWSELLGAEQQGSSLLLRRRNGPPVRLSGLRARQVELLRIVVDGRLRQLASSNAAKDIAQPAPPPCP